MSEQEQRIIISGANPKEARRIMRAISQTFPHLTIELEEREGEENKEPLVTPARTPSVVVTRPELPESFKERWQLELLETRERTAKMRALYQEGKNTSAFRDLNTQMNDHAYYLPQVPFDSTFVETVILLFEKSIELYSIKYPPDFPPYKIVPNQSGFQYRPKPRESISIRYLRITMDKLGLDNEDGLRLSDTQIMQKENTSQSNVFTGYYSVIADLRQAFPHPQL